MTAPDERPAGARLGRLAIQFGKFGIVGVIGFGVDVAVLLVVLTGFGLEARGETGLLVARVPSFLAAATVTWALNRAFTFRAADTGRPERQWAKFIAANSVGGLVNYGAYSLCVIQVALFAEHPELAVAIGSLAGMVFNFTASKYVVFRGA